MQQAHLSRRVPGGLALLAALILALLVVTPAFAATPAVTSIAPSSGSSAGGTAITITGTGLTGTTAVKFGTVDATSFANVTDTSVTAVAPAHVAGAVNVIVTNADGSSAIVAGDLFTFVDVPTVTGILPINGSTGGGDVVTIAGTGFVLGPGNTTVTFGGVASTSVAVASTTQLTALAPPHAAGAVDIRVTTAGGTSPNVVADNFTYASAIPVITTLSPAAGTPAGSTVVTITGSGFTGATGATFGGVTATGFIVDTDTQIRVASPVHVAGIVDVVVNGPGGASVTGTATKYTYTTASIPVVSALSPSSSPIIGGTVVSITGTGFTGATSVTFGGTAATTTSVLSDASILATAPAHAAGIVDVIVTTPAGVSVAATGSKFTYGSATLPVVTTISPTAGGTGTVVTITGTGFTGATAVMFGTISATPTSVSDTQIVVTAPTGASGAVDVTVVTPAGTSAVVTLGKFTFPGSTNTYTLSVRWSLIVWQGKNGISATAALKGIETPDNPATNDVSTRVTAMYSWNAGGQKWDGFFPGSENIPGANDFTTLSKGVAYWTAINGSSAATWTIEQG